MDVFLDVFFVVTHAVLVAFNLLGWIWTKTRRIHLVTIMIDALNRHIIGGAANSISWHANIVRDPPRFPHPAANTLLVDDGLKPPKVRRSIRLPVLCRQLASCWHSIKRVMTRTLRGAAWPRDL